MNKIHTTYLNLSFSGRNFKSYLAHPTNTDKALPGVLVIPEFWGLTEYIQTRTRQLAELGYCAIAVDIYGNGWIAQNVKSASLAMQKLLANLKESSNQILSQLEELKNLKQTDETKTAVIGYCLGGSLALHLARIGTDIKGVVSFHGDLEPHTTIQANQVRSKILVCHGANDTMIPQEKVINFKKEMDTAGVDYKFVSYEGALHGFTNPQATENGNKFGIPLAHNKQADQASWEEMKSFFTQIFS